MAFPIGSNESKAGGRTLIAEGVKSAVCVGFFDLGFQVSNYKGEEKIQRKVLFTWEVNQQITEGDYVGKNMRISNRYTLSSFKNALLGKMLTSWTGKAMDEQALREFDLESLVGKPCMLMIIHNGEYANVETVMQLADGMSPLAPNEILTEAPDWVKSIQAKSVGDPNKVEHGMEDVQERETHTETKEPDDIQSKDVQYDDIPF